MGQHTCLDSLGWRKGAKAREAGPEHRTKAVRTAWVAAKGVTSVRVGPKGLRARRPGRGARASARCAPLGLAQRG